MMKTVDETLFEITPEILYLADLCEKSNAIDKELFKKILSKHGDDKILFATDCPWRDIKDDVQIIKSFNLNKETEEKIFYKNALRLLGLGE